MNIAKMLIKLSTTNNKKIMLLYKKTDFVV